MGNRVAKSGKHPINLNGLSVKVQRVYGSCCSRLSKLQLRCTLTARETGYPIKILSNLASTLAPLNPWFLVGFIDAEGSFMIKVSLTKVKLDFTIGLHIKDLELLQQIQRYFGVGVIGFKVVDGKPTCYWSVRRLPELLTVIIPFIDQYPLQTQKMADFLLFKQRAFLMNMGVHLTEAGLNIIVGLKAVSN